MKIGQIIRRLTKSGCPIGQPMIVVKIKNKRTYVRYFGNKNAFPLQPTANFIVFSKGVARISYKDYHAVKDAGVFYSHAVGKQWDKLYEEKPQIIQLTAIGEKPLLFVVDFWCKRLIKGVPCIRVYFKHQLYDDI